MRRNSSQTADIGADILKSVRANDGISRVQLARDLKLAPSTVGVYVERLISDGFLTESEKASPDFGRPPILLRTNPSGGRFIGVDFEARNIMAVAVDFSDQPLRNAHEYIEPGDSVAEVISKIEKVISVVMQGGNSPALAMGVGVPGIVDSSKGLAIHYRYIDNWRNVALADHLSKRFNMPVYLENTVRSMALAELWFGRGRREENFICVGIRSGIGVGMILNGNLHCGAHFAAGELGRWQISPNKELLKYFDDSKSSGRRKVSMELQELASVRSIQKALERAVNAGMESILNKNTRITVKDVTQAVQQRDSLTNKVISLAASILGVSIGQLVLTVDPAKVVLSGPVALWGEAFLHPLRKSVTDAVEPAGLNVPEIVNSTMGEFSGALGAAALALHKWKPNLDPVHKAENGS